MSNPPYGVPGNQGTPWPQYGDNGAGAPMQGMPMQGGPQNFQGGGYGGPVTMPIVKGPSKAPGVILIVVGILMAIVVAPILFFVLMFRRWRKLGRRHCRVERWDHRSWRQRQLYGVDLAR